MFKLGKNKVSESKTDTALTSGGSESVHVMPRKFYVAPKKGNNGLVIIIVVGVLVVGGLAAAAIFLNLSLGKNQASNQNSNTNTSASVTTNTGNTNVNINSNVNANIGMPATTTIDVPTTTDPAVNINVNTNTSIDDPDIKDVEVKPLPSAPDSDNDGLTLEEENLYGTDPSLLDSDNDGFSDGSELLNGYDPTHVGQTLEASGVFTKHTGAGYSISYPTGWQVRPQSDNSETLFISSTGEFVAVIIMENPDKLPLAEWYAKQYPDIDITNAVSVRLNSFSGYRHPDNRIYFLTKSGDISKIFMVNYNVGNFRLTNFATTFNLMVKSLN
ncbi:MAG: hypothetical protein HUU49_03870 [Candidatus Buchananbacteria bacterium]|nr:hypothetical protein [Candidatus Buchananbacteria bacterium]